MTLDFINLRGLFVSSGVFFFFGFIYSLVKSWGRKARLVALLVTLVLSLPAFAFTLYYFHILPEKAWFYELRSWNHSEDLMLLAGGFMAVLASFFRRWMLPLWLVLLGGIAIAPFAKPLLAPLPVASLKDEWQGRACMQSTYSTCGPASVTTILRLLGDAKATEREAALACYSYMGGTEAWYLARYVRSRGLRARFDFREGLAPDVHLPAVAGVRTGMAGHFIALLGREGDVYVVADPLLGEERMTLDEMRQRYEFTGFFMVVEKP